MPKLVVRNWAGGQHAVVVLAVLLLALAAVASFGALTAYGRPVAGALLDANGHISDVGPSDWDARRQGFGFPARVVSVDGFVLDRRPGLVAEQWDEIVRGAVRRGQEDVSVVVAMDGEQHATRFVIHHLDGLSWWLFAAMSLATGLLWSSTGLIALWVEPKSRLARATAQVGLSIGVFMLTIFDMHTNRLLVPVFWLAYALVPSGFVSLALRLPDDAALLRHVPWLESAVFAAGLALGGALVFGHATGASIGVLQVVAGSQLGAGLLVFAIAFVWRWVRSQGPQRATMRVLAWSMVPPFTAAALFVLFSSLGDWRYGDLMMYPLLGVAPIATVHAIVRYDIFASRAVLSRLLTRVALSVVVWLGATVVGASVAGWLGLELRFAVLAVGLAALVAALSVAAILELSDRVLFSAEAAYKPTVAKLSAELTGITSPAAVAVAIERTIRHWLPCDSVKLTLLDTPRRWISGEWAVGVDRLAGHGTPEGGRFLEVAFAGMTIAELEVGPKPGSQLYTTTDLDLLATIVDQGSLALAHAHAYEELELRRREQAQAWRGERAALVETVAGEIAHEIRHPINFFRSVFDHASSQVPLDEEEIEVGREEVERLERLVAGLRRLTGGQVERAPIGMATVCERATRLLRDALGERTVKLEVPAAVVVRCDHDKVIQVLVNLLSNALDASGPSGSVGIVWRATSHGGALVVWDDGPGFEGDPSRLFAPWHTTKQHGTGLGLAIAYRLVRAHDWKIRAERVDTETRFVVDVRREDLSRASEATTREVA